MKKALIDPKIKPGGITSRKGGIILPDWMDDEKLMKRSLSRNYGVNFGLFYLIRRMMKWFKSK